ncbi:hypothetical protein [uncultured Luteimonas sp.]|uniref:hypothetical protein n=1 Tax=uncultured Luteimonas sp. TaxID=453144 RepID=UPI00261F61C9|nr:hypothetical protein [uncultured Luteimonas sp.]
MSQRAFLQAFDAAAFGTFAAAGIADAAEYLAPDAAPGAPAVPCTVLVDRNVEDFGDDIAPVSAFRTRITFQVSELAAEEGGVVSLLDAAGLVTESFTLAQRTRHDEGISAWWVQHG